MPGANGSDAAMETIFEIVNPSDPYTIDGTDRLAACVATLFLGSGGYGLRDADGELIMPILVFGGFEEWLRQQAITDFDAWMTEHIGAVIHALDSVQIGSAQDRRRMQAVWAAISDPAERAKAQAAWHDERRSSMNNIGVVARDLAALLRARQTGAA